jgi:predicted RNA-binding protein YlqC (UPF0109 family)
MNHCQARFSTSLIDLATDEIEKVEHEPAGLQEVCVMTEATQMATGNDSMKKMIDLVTEIARALVDRPESVTVEALPDHEGTILRLRVAQTDIGKIIGKQGRTARSLRTILAAASMKMKHRFSLDIVEEGELSPEP